jgi:tRNA-splicing ligase RtcB
MDLNLLKQHGPSAWEIPAQGKMQVPAMIYASRELVQAMEHKVYEQAVNVAMLPGIVGASSVMPDAPWGYGVPIGCVAARVGK